MGSPSSMDWRRMTDRRGSSPSEDEPWSRPVGLRICNSSPLPTVISILPPGSAPAELVWILGLCRFCCCCCRCDCGIGSADERCWGIDEEDSALEV